MALTDTTREEMRQIVARYPRSRSAIMPMLHLVQSEEGFITSEGIVLIAEVLGLTEAEVTAVATFYTQYKRKPQGEYHVGVCTNTMCAVMGGDEIFASLKEHLEIGNDQTTEDGRISLEHVECNAACDYAPVVMVNWEFFDNQTPSAAIELVDALRSGRPVTPTRGATLCSFRETSRTLAGLGPQVYDDSGPGAPTLAGLRTARAQGDPC